MTWLVISLQEYYFTITIVSLHKYIYIYVYFNLVHMPQTNNRNQTYSHHLYKLHIAIWLFEIYYLKKITKIPNLAKMTFPYLFSPEFAAVAQKLCHVIILDLPPSQDASGKCRLSSGFHTNNISGQFIINP